MGKQSKGCFNSIIGTVVLFGFTLASIFLMPVITGNKSVVGSFLHFMLPPWVLFFTIRTHEIWSGIGGLIRVFKKSSPKPDTRPGLKYGSAALPISIIFYGIVGVVMGLLNYDIFEQMLISYVLIGVFWGVLVYILMQKEYFDEDSF